MSNLGMSANFDFIMDWSSRKAVSNGYTAISQLELWEWLKTFTPEHDKGFMFSDNKNISKIITKMESLPDAPGHSGSSFGWTMRQLEFIAKQGLDKYKDLCISNRC